MSQDSGSNFALGLILGTAVGIGIGLLYAPHPGEETRALLRDRAAEFSERADGFADKVKESAAHARQNMETRLSDTE